MALWGLGSASPQKFQEAPGRGGGVRGNTILPEDTEINHSFHLHGSFPGFLREAELGGRGGLCYPPPFLAQTTLDLS